MCVIPLDKVLDIFINLGNTLFFKCNCQIRSRLVHIKIRLRDVAPSNAYLEIRENRYGNNKTSSALRRVLLRELLTDTDKVFFAKVVHQRKEAHGDTLIATEAGNIFSAKDLSKTLSQLIKQTTGLPYLSVHHLRHSCLTNFQLMSFLYDEDNGFAGCKGETINHLKELLPYDDDKAVLVLQAIQSPLGYKQQYALAGIAGHSSPSITFESYVHLTDIEIGLKLWYQNFKFDQRHAPIFNVPKRKVKDFLSYPDAISSYWLREAKLKPFEKPKNSRSIKNQPAKAQSNVRKYAFSQVKQVMDAYVNQDIDTLHHLMQIFTVEEAVLESWLSHAKFLRENARFITSRGNSRLFDSDDKLSLLPNFDRLANDREMMAKMTNAYRILHQKKSQRIKLYEWVWHTLTHCQIHKNHIDFYDAKSLFAYLEILAELVDKKRVRLLVLNTDYLNTLPKRQQNAWQKAFKVLPQSQIIKQDSRTFGFDTYAKKLKVELGLASQNESTRLANQEPSNHPISSWTVRTLQIFCHYVFVMIGERILPHIETTSAENQLDKED